jgi:hypothetical protein
MCWVMKAITTGTRTSRPSVMILGNALKHVTHARKRAKRGPMRAAAASYVRRPFAARDQPAQVLADGHRSMAVLIRRWRANLRAPTIARSNVIEERPMRATRTHTSICSSKRIGALYSTSERTV